MIRDIHNKPFLDLSSSERLVLSDFKIIGLIFKIAEAVLHNATNRIEKQ